MKSSLLAETRHQAPIAVTWTSSTEVKYFEASAVVTVGGSVFGRY